MRPRARTRGERARRARRVLARYLFVLPAVLFMLVFFAYPIATNIAISLQDVGLATFVNGNGPFIGLANYWRVLDLDAFAAAARNTAIFTVVSLAVQFTLGMLLALFFNRPFPLSRTLRALFLLPWLVPFVVTGTAYKWLFTDPNGLANYLIVDLLHIVPRHQAWLADTQLALPVVILANIWIGIPFNMIILHSGLQSIPGEVYEAAALDGAGPWMSFWRITLPLLRPVSAVLLILGLIATIKAFGLIYLLTGGGPADATTTFLILAYRLSFGEFLFGQGAAAGNIVALIALLCAIGYLILMRRERTLT